jgi:Domain of unknown function (DUF4202)
VTGAPDDRFDRAIAAIDAVNAADPNVVEVRGERRPKELLHAELVTGWVRRLAPGAGDPLLLAARGHHLRRWAIPRSSYPEGRAGYLRWRRAQHTRHARELGEILTAAGYDHATIERVAALVTKHDLGHDPDAQVLEDALCLVFVETQFHDLAARLDPDTMVEVVRKTARKMSPRAVELAAGLDLADGDRAVLRDALAG